MRRHYNIFFFFLAWCSAVRVGLCGVRHSPVWVEQHMKLAIRCRDGVLFARKSYVPDRFARKKSRFDPLLGLIFQLTAIST